MKIKINYKRIFLYLEVIAIIYLSGGTRSAITRGIDYYVMTFFMLAIASVYGGGTIKGKKDLKKLFIYMVFLAGFFVINLYIFPKTAMTLIYKEICFLIFVLFSKYIMQNNIDIMSYFYNVIIAIAWINFILFLLIEILQLPIPYTEIYSIYNLGVYKNYFDVYMKTTGSILYVGNLCIQRIAAFFWEPGIYAIYLNFALYYHVFQEKNKKQSKFVILLINLVLTFSTTGLILAISIFAIFIMKSKTISKRTKIVIMLPLCAITFAIALIIVYYKKFDITTNSYKLRVHDLIVGLEIFRENIVFGTGFMNTDVFVYRQPGNRGNSNGLVTWMFTTGMFGVSIMLYPFVNRLMHTDKKFDYLVYLIAFLISNMTEPLYIYPFMIYIVAKEYSEWSFRYSYKEG